MKHDMGDVMMWHEIGIIPSFLDLNDERKAQEQFNERYSGGWNPMEGFTVSWHDVEIHGMNLSVPVLRYPGDPPLNPIAVLPFRDQEIYIFPYAWVMVVDNPDDGDDVQYEISRMD